jgi:2,3-bisphosphoglycerate-dependent phosphoglycerate mutase
VTAPIIQLIRHGESIANAGGISRTPACIPLSEKGQKQALILADQFPKPPDLIVISAFIRTHQTAAPLLQKYPHVPVETWPVHEFTYLAHHSYNNTTEAQRTPAAKAYWNRLDPDYCDGPGAESFADFIARADALMAKLATQTHSHISIFTHSFFISAVQWRSLNPQAEVNADFIRGYLDFRLKNPVENAQPLPFQR